MLRRELIRIGVLGAFGLVLMIILLVSNYKISEGNCFIAPFYVIGTFYAGSHLIKLFMVVLKTYLSCQFISIITNPFWGTILCVMTLLCGIVLLISCGWIYGLGRCLYSIYQARKLDTMM